MVFLQPKKGRLLIAEPSILNDISFKRSIVFLTECTKKNVVGFILNKALDYTVNDLIPEIDCDFTVFKGGPVNQNNLYFIHKVPHLIFDSIKVSEGIYWCGNFEILKNLLSTKQLKNSDIRFFLGYSGWNVCQLNDELSMNSWFVSENDYPNIFLTDSSCLWKNKLLQKGGVYKIWANAPNDIRYN